MAAPVVSAERSSGTISTISIPAVPRRASALQTRIVTVCHPVWQLGCGGLERQLLQTIAGLPQDRFRHVLVVRGAESGSLATDPLELENVRIVRPSSPAKDRLWPLRLARILRDNSVDVLHVRGLSMLLDSVAAAKLCGRIRVAFSFHGFEGPAIVGGPHHRPPARFGLLRRLAYRAAAAHCDDRWAVSHTAAAAIASELRLPTGDFAVLANGVDTERFAPAARPAEIRRRLGLPMDRLVVLSVGNLKPIKGHDVLLEALQQLRGDAGRLTLVLVGEDHLHGALQDWTREHLATMDIRFIGQQGDTLPWYQAADLFVLPSRWEGLSNALLEAMSCGLPVVATAVGGNVDVIEHARTGLLVDPENAVELAMALRWLMKDEACRSVLGAAARAHVQMSFNAPQAIARYADCYAELARELPPANRRRQSAQQASRRAKSPAAANIHRSTPPRRQVAGLDQ